MRVKRQLGWGSTMDAGGAMMVERIPKPKHLGPAYGDQFKDDSVVRAYAHRPAYAIEVLSVLDGLTQDEPRVVLDIGCGPGRIAIPLASVVDHVDAVDPSEAMIRVARSRPGGDRADIRWVVQSAEEFSYPATYSLIMAVGSLHWMDWYTVMPKMADALSPRGYLAIVQNVGEGAPWSAQLKEIIPRYSTNQDFAPYNLLEELGRRRLFSVAGRERMEPRLFSESVDDYIESLHSMNGFLRQRMSASAAIEFDAAARAAVRPFATDGVVTFEMATEVIWGRPSGGP